MKEIIRNHSFENRIVLEDNSIVLCENVIVVHENTGYLCKNPIVLQEKYNVSKGNSIALFSSNTFAFLLRVSWGTQYLCENAKAFFLPSHIFSITMSS